MSHTCTISSSCLSVADYLKHVHRPENEVILAHVIELPENAHEASECETAAAVPSTSARDELAGLVSTRTRVVSLSAQVYSGTRKSLCSNCADETCPQ